MMNRGSIPRRDRHFIPPLKAFRPVLGPCQPHTEGVLEGSFPGVKERRREQTYPLHSAETSFGGGARHLSVSPPLCNARILCKTKR
jgi:hypothetical protein